MCLVLVSQLTLVMMVFFQQIIQSLVNQLGADSAQANISTSASVSLCCFENVQCTFQGGGSVSLLLPGFEKAVSMVI